MAQVYVYRARNRQGKIIRGRLMAESAGAASAMLREKKLYVVEIKPGRTTAGTSLKLPDRKVGTRDLALFCRQFATMFSCGIPIIHCLNILTHQTGSKKLAEAVQGTVKLLEKGRSLSDAARAYPEVFPGVFISMLEAGETGGAMDQVLERLACHYEREHDLREKVKSAMTYPAVVAAVAALAVAGLIMFALPVYVGMLTQYDAELPLVTKIVMGAGNIMRNYWYVLLVLILSTGYAYRRFSATRRGRELVDGLSLRLPVFGGLVRRVIISRFARTLGALLAGGVPLLQAFDVVKKTAGNVLVEKAIAEAAACVEEGRGLARPLQKTGIFPPMVTRMITVGEETGELDTMLGKIADYYDREVEDTVTRLSSLMEPLLVLSIGGVVGFIVMSMILPMFSFMNAVE